MKTIYRIFIFLLISAVSACVSNQTNRTAGNDEDRDIGLGGTGVLARYADDQSDIGLGGTGIRGVITGFGSIFVNGVEIEYNKETPLTINGRTGNNHSLEIGDVVEVLTVDNKQHTDARRINIRHEVIGTVQTVDPVKQSFTVLNQTILLSDNNSTLPEQGTMVAVSGFRKDNKTIQATRVVPSQHQKPMLRTTTALPYNKQAKRWLIQTNIRSGNISFTNNKTKQEFSIKENNNISTGRNNLPRIFKLEKTDSGAIKLTGEIDSHNLSQGIASPVIRHNRGHIQMFRNNLPRMHR